MQLANKDAKIHFRTKIIKLINYIGIEILLILFCLLFQNIILFL